MLRRAVWALGSGALVLVCSTLAHAQCTKDIDCKGDRVCEGGQCTSPVPVAPPAAPPDAAPGAPVDGEPVTLDESPTAEGQPAPPPAASAPAAGAATRIPVIPPEAVQPLGADEPAVRRRNRGMMIGGIMMVSIGPLALLGALSARNSQENCDSALENEYPNHVVPAYDKEELERCDGYTLPIYLLGIGGAVLVGAGVPMIIYGAKNVPTKPVTRAQLLPWATPQSGGVRLRLTL
jgi:hypothetical protein